MVMKNQKQTSSIRKKIHSFYEHQEYLSIQQNPYRARSVTVGTAFGGVVELVVRSDAATVWAQMQPVEAIELMEQIAAGCGIEIAMRPKQNFASWRGWEDIIGQKIQIEGIEWKGTAPYQLRHQLKHRINSQESNLLKESDESSANLDKSEQEFEKKKSSKVEDLKIDKKKPRSRSTRKNTTNILPKEEEKENE